MERWAKAQNKRNESGKNSADGSTGSGAGGEGSSGGTGAADAAFAVLLERRTANPPTETKNLTLKMQLKKEPPTPVSSIGVPPDCCQ